ncbi:hypothetical protein [Mycolicibacterium brisbanense]
MTAGVALVGAGVIAVTPVAAPPPAIQTHAVQLSAAIDNPVDVFTPVFDQAVAALQTAIQDEIANPLPVARAILAKATADGKTLGDIATALTPVIQNMVTGFPVTTGVALNKLAEGDLDGALGAYVGLFFGPVWVGFMQYQKVVGLVQDTFEIAQRATTAAMYYTWGTIAVASSAFGFAQTVAANLEEVGKSIGTGDPTNVVNAVEHGVANVAAAAISQASFLKFALDFRGRLATAINPPPPDPEELTAKVTPKATTLSLPATETPAIEAPATEATAETSPGTTAASSTDVKTTPEATAPAAHDTAVSTPAKTGTTTNKTAAKRVSDVGKRVTDSVNKIGEGLKKALSKPAKADHSDAGAGSSGDAT